METATFVRFCPASFLLILNADDAGDAGSPIPSIKSITWHVYHPHCIHDCFQQHSFLEPYFWELLLQFKPAAPPKSTVFGMRACDACECLSSQNHASCFVGAPPVLDPLPLFPGYCCWELNWLEFGSLIWTVLPTSTFSK